MGSKVVNLIFIDLLSGGHERGARPRGVLAVFNMIGNTVMNNDNADFFNCYPTFNSLEKLMETVEENIKIYERLLQSEKEKIEYLEKLGNLK